MADEGALVGVGMPAAAAVLGVEGVLQLRQRLRGVLDPEVDDARARALIGVAAEVGDQRIVGVEDEGAAAGSRRHRLRPLVGQRLHLAVAVELVAEEVAEHDRRRLQLVDDPWQPGLVDLEQPLASMLLQQRRRHAPGHVRAGPVVDRVAAVGGEDGGDHPGRGRLAVGGADHRRAALEPGAEPGDRLGIEAQQHPPRQRRAAAATARPAGGTERPRRRHLGAEERPAAAPPGAHRRAQAPAGAGTRTLSACGSTRSEAGRSVRCSPSA